MAEYKVNNVTVRIFGTPNEEKLKEACKQYVKGINYGLLERNSSIWRDSTGNSTRKEVPCKAKEA